VDGAEEFRDADTPGAAKLDSGVAGELPGVGELVGKVVADSQMTGSFFDTHDLRAVHDIKSYKRDPLGARILR
jgi:hypothetical protein